VKLLDCPVVKSQPAAVKGELGIYVGGDKEAYEQVKPILECMGHNIIYMGGNGTGLTMKILHNGLVGEIQNGVNEMLSMAASLGLNLSDVVTALGYGGAQCFYLDSKAKNIIADALPDGFQRRQHGQRRPFLRRVGRSAKEALPWSSGRGQSL
jgi:3-hydroxyisobutyrate dehydrogenase-like beta-hydroxyacid dehydrogenase